MLQDIVPGRYRNKRMRNVHYLVKIVVKATENFMTVADQVAAENPEFQVKR